MPDPADPQRVAEASAAAMWETDHATRGLGVVMLKVAPGEARLKMRVRPDMANGHGMCHGGFLFALADSAFAFACNSRSQKMVASQGAITFLAPAKVGETLTAQAREVHRRGRGGLYDVSVINEVGETIAEFRGHCRAIPGELTPPD